MNEDLEARRGPWQLDDIRRLVEERLDRRIEDYQWQGLLNQRYPIPDYKVYDDEEAAVREAVMATVQAWRDFYRHVPSSVARPRRTPGGSEMPRLEALRRDALRALYAADARQHEGLLEFRHTVLHDQLLPAAGDQVDEACRDWIMSASADGWQYYGRLMSTRYVADAPDEGNRYAIPEPLRSLHGLTEELGKRYDWVKGAATMFVLTDLTPEVHPLRASGRIPYSWISASRITLVIDPALPPDYVADFYRSIRRDFYGGAKVRPLTEKALLLAAFSASTNDHERAAEQLRRWNALHPDHAYDETDPAAVSNFRRDFKQARDRLLHPKLGQEAWQNPVTPPSAPDAGAAS